ncbi:MAG: hypothetical protein R3E58_09020 [Phycisphaerae bacterium]
MADKNKQSESESTEIPGIKKAAILLTALNADVSSRILKFLDPDVIEDITREIAQLDIVDPVMRGRVIDEFYHLALARQYVDAGGFGYAKTLLEKALRPDEAKRIISVIEHQVYQQPFAFLQKAESEVCLRFVGKNTPRQSLWCSPTCRQASRRKF